MPVVERFKINNLGADYVVGDIHGAFDKLQIELDAIGFDTTKDRLFAVGDLVDRHPGSEKFLDWLDKPWFFSVRGNHEEMLIGHYLLDPSLTYTHLANGGMWYGEWQLPGLLRERMYRECLKLPFIIEIETPGGIVGILHADTGLELDWEVFKQNIINRDEKARETCLWSRMRQTNKLQDWIDGVKMVYAGHTPATTVRTFGNLQIIDTGACFETGHFTIMRIE